MGLKPQPPTGGTHDPFHFQPWIIYDPVPPWLRDHLPIDVLKEMTVIQLRTQRVMHEEHAKSLQQMEELLRR